MRNAQQIIRLVIADDHPIVLEGIAKVLEAEGDFEMCAKCSNGADALRAIREHRPDVAVLDIVMPGISGLDALARINSDKLDTKTIFLTANATDAHIFALIEQGARALLMKDTSISELPRCIRQVAEGGRFFPNDIVAAAVERETGRRLVGEQFERVLSAREREVVLLVAEGLPNKEVARRLNLSEGTVRIHVHNIYQKTGIGSRSALTALALTHRDLLRP
jgi:two-component system, NarL family, nitrate/nitrite response regulator NarL